MPDDFKGTVRRKKSNGGLRIRRMRLTTIKIKTGSEIALTLPILDQNKKLKFL